jgi:hypothetical protein
VIWPGSAQTAQTAKTERKPRSRNKTETRVSSARRGKPAQEGELGRDATEFPPCDRTRPVSCLRRRTSPPPRRRAALTDWPRADPPCGSSGRTSASTFQPGRTAVPTIAGARSPASFAAVPNAHSPCVHSPCPRRRPPGAARTGSTPTARRQLLSRRQK